MNENLFQERLRELEASVEEGKKHSVPDTEREKDLAAAAHPKDKITHKDVLVKRGVLKAESVEIEESVNDDDYYIVNHNKKHIARRISGKNAKVEFHTDLSKHFKADIDSANKKHGNGHVAIKGMDLKHKGEYSRVAEDVEQIEELSKGTLGRYIKKASDDFPQHQHTADEITKTANPHKPLPDKATKALNKVWRRKIGIHGAVDRLTKEDVELDEELVDYSNQLDELSKEKLAWYLKKASKHIDRKGENMIKRDKKLKKNMNPLSRRIGGLVSRQDSIASAAKKFLAKEGVDLDEKTLTPAELKKREEIATAMERDKPGMNKSKKMAIATAVAKRVAESEQIDELSKATLTSYRDAAKERRKEHNSAIQRASSIKDTMGDEDGRLEKAIEYHSKEHDRLGGKMKIAARKIKKIKEGVEQVSELSRYTLASYYAKSISDRHSKDLARDSAKRKGDEKEADALGRKVTNRSSGIEKAKAKFFKEEADPTN